LFLTKIDNQFYIQKACIYYKNLFSELFIDTAHFR